MVRGDRASQEQRDTVRRLKLLMRFILVAVALMLASCARLQRNTSQMTADQMLQRSSHVFIGVIEKHEYPNKLLFRVSGEDAERWRVIDMRVRVEMVLRGIEPRSVIDIYEAFPTGGLTGDWNLTHNNSRYLFLYVWRMATIT